MDVFCIPLRALHDGANTIDVNFCEKMSQKWRVRTSGAKRTNQKFQNDVCIMARDSGASYATVLAYISLSLVDYTNNRRMNPTSSNCTGVEGNNGVVIMSSTPLIDRRLKKDNSNDRTASSTPATSTSSSPHLQPSTTPHIHFSGFALQLNDTITTVELEDSSNDDNIAASSSSSSCNSVVIASPASQKSLRTHNPIRAIVDPIMAHSVKCGKVRGDGKDQISLAVSR